MYTLILKFIFDNCGSFGPDKLYSFYISNPMFYTSNSTMWKCDIIKTIIVINEIHYY